MNSKKTVKKKIANKKAPVVKKPVKEKPPVKKKAVKEKTVDPRMQALVNQREALKAEEEKLKATLKKEGEKEKKLQAKIVKSTKGISRPLAQLTKHIGRLGKIIPTIKTHDQLESQALTMSDLMETVAKSIGDVFDNQSELITSITGVEPVETEEDDDL